MPPAKRSRVRGGKRWRVAGPAPHGIGDELFAVKQELREAMGRLQDDGDVEFVLALMQSRPSGKPGSRKKAPK